jgi:CubicO group peptidase (beta-lactamase class C family)
MANFASYVIGQFMPLFDHEMISRTQLSTRHPICGLLALLVLASPTHAQNAPRLDEAAVARIDGFFARHAGMDRPGYAVGVIVRGSLAYAKGFGSANLDHRISITPDSVFNAASLSKQFTAACVGLLITRGRLSLESEVREYIPEFPERFGSVQVQHLIYMTSGLPDYYQTERPGGRNWDQDHFTVRDAQEAVFSQPALEFEPGTRWAYRNSNYQLLAEIVERVSGVKYSEFARREIFAPLGMIRTHVNDDLGRIVPGRVTGYNALEGGGYRQELRRSPHYGGSGVFTTLEDLARWDRSFRDHSLAGKPLTELLLQTRKFGHNKTNDAFGLVWGQYRGESTLWYEGGDLGFSSYMVRLPKQDLSVIVLSNLGTGRAADHATAVLDVLFEKH